MQYFALMEVYLLFLLRWVNVTFLEAGEGEWDEAET